jgi:phage terminase large subunit
VFDLGFNDHMAIALVQRHLSEIRIIDYIQDTGRTLNDYSEQLKAKKYNWGRLWLPHDGYSSDYKTGFSSASIMRRLGWDVPDRSEISELSIEEGIRVTKLSFPQIYIDAERCGQLVECLKRYRRRINRETMTPGAPLHDEFSDGADCARYICVNAPNMHNDDAGQYWADEYDRNQYDERAVNAATGY